MKYFSIDYRSPPSGMGQIIDTNQPEMIGDRYNYILVTYSGNGQEDNPYYVQTKHFSSKEAEEQGWSGPVMKDIIQFLRDQCVTHVYDSELSYEEDGSDDGMFPLERWTDIMMNYL